MALPIRRTLCLFLWSWHISDYKQYTKQVLLYYKFALITPFLVPNSQSGQKLCASARRCRHLKCVLVIEAAGHCGGPCCCWRGRRRHVRRPAAAVSAFVVALRRWRRWYHVITARRGCCVSRRNHLAGVNNGGGVCTTHDDK